MINSAITFTDKFGEHICHNTGRKVIVDVPQYAKTLEEELIYGVREATHDSSVHPGVKLTKRPGYDFYGLKTASCLYYVRKHNSCIEVIVDEKTGMGFPFTDFYGISDHVEGDIVVFWTSDKNSKNRISHYNYFIW